MKKRFVVVVFVVILLALAACSAPAAKLKLADSGSTLDLKNGQTFTVALEGAPTTGYIWELKEIDPAVVELVGEPEYKSDSILIGSGGVFTYKFKTIAAGTSNLKLVYYRPWKDNVEPLKVFMVQVNVK
jgi:inhibitor of cysteine peptidase